jgi:hypothetical protein
MKLGTESPEGPISAQLEAEGPDLVNTTILIMRTPESLAAESRF